MPVFSQLHQLFNVTTCYAYIHTLRWKDRPLHCPRCQSQDVRPWGATTMDQLLKLVERQAGHIQERCGTGLHIGASYASPGTGLL